MSKKKQIGNRRQVPSTKAKKKSGEITELKQQLGELTEDLQRIQADFINFKKRSTEETDRQRTLAQRQMVAVLLPTIDNIERALTHVPKELVDNAWAQGVKSTADQMFESLKKMGVEKIKTVGEHFDPELMEAVQVEDGEGDNEIVSEELQSGYTMKGDLIRHAMVKVRREK